MATDTQVDMAMKDCTGFRFCLAELELLMLNCKSSVDSCRAWHGPALSLSGLLTSKDSMQIPIYIYIYYSVHI